MIVWKVFSQQRSEQSGGCSSAELLAALILVPCSRAEEPKLPPDAKVLCDLSYVTDGH